VLSFKAAGQAAKRRGGGTVRQLGKPPKGGEGELSDSCTRGGRAAEGGVGD
jgi:hypothetical protein